MGAGKLTACSCHRDRAVKAPISRGDRRREGEMGAGWGQRVENGNILGRNFLPLPSLQSMESLSDRSGPPDPAKPSPPLPQPTVARGLPINPFFPACPTSGYHFPVSKPYKHLICKSPSISNTHLCSRRPETSNARWIRKLESNSSRPSHLLAGVGGKAQWSSLGSRLSFSGLSHCDLVIHLGNHHFAL